MMDLMVYLSEIILTKQNSAKMYRENMEASWPSISEKLITKFPKLKLTDLVFQKGDEEQVIRKIQLRLYKSKKEVLEILSAM